MVLSLQEDVEICSEKPHYYPIDTVLQWHDPVFKSSKNPNIHNKKGVARAELEKLLSSSDDDESDRKGPLLMTQSLIAKARIALVFVSWNKFQTVQQKSELLYEFMKSFQLNQKRKDLKSRGQQDLTREIVSMLFFLSTTFFSKITDLVEDYVQTQMKQ